jgi:hypothetical protein
MVVMGADLPVVPDARLVQLTKTWGAYLHVHALELPVNPPAEFSGGFEPETWAKVRLWMVDKVLVQEHLPRRDVFLHTLLTAELGLPSLAGCAGHAFGMSVSGLAQASFLFTRMNRNQCHSMLSAQWTDQRKSTQRRGALEIVLATLHAMPHRQPCC